MRAVDGSVWFHVDDLSSAHVYLRLPIGASKLDDITPAVLAECCQLVKENSIEGCKKDRVSVCYTKWKNLRRRRAWKSARCPFTAQRAARHGRQGQVGGQGPNKTRLSI